MYYKEWIINAYLSTDINIFITVSVNKYYYEKTTKNH